jgi:phage tail P2-like protein
MFDIKNIDISALVPDNLKGDPEIWACIQALNGEMQAVSNLCELPFYFNRIDDLTENELDHLAWQFFILSTEWGLTTTIEQKRELLKNAFILNRLRGTRWAVERILALVNFTPQLQEWFEYGGQPYTFRLTVSEFQNIGLQNNQVEILLRLISEYKSHRSHLEALDVTLDAEKGISAYVGCAVTSVGTLDVYPDGLPESIDSDSDINVVMGGQSTIILNVGV